MGSLAGKRILVVEDEYLLAMTLEDILAEFGAQIVGPATRIEEAIELAETAQINAALLDVNLNGKRSDAVAEILARRQIPFVFATGYGSSSPGHQHLTGAEVLQKPYQPQQMLSALVKAMGDRV